MFKGQRWFAQAHGQWMIISYVWVLETNTGATWRVASLRIVRLGGRHSRTFYPPHILCQIGTILGAVYAYIVSDARHFGGPSFIPIIMNVS
jgi:hypothetical protein